MKSLMLSLLARKVITRRTEVNEDGDTGEEEIGGDDSLDDVSSSVDSAASTQHARKCKNRIADFSILAWKPRAQSMKEPNDSDDDSDNDVPLTMPDMATVPSLKVVEFVPISIEIKRGTSRSLRNATAEWSKTLDGAFIQAK